VAPLVTDLDQLRDVAACADIFLREKVLGLAVASAGLLTARDGRRSAGPGGVPDSDGGGGPGSTHAEYLRPEDVFNASRLPEFAAGGGAGGPPLGGRPRDWGAALKPSRRVLEKLLRCYGNDPSRLLDYCRQGLVFETPADLLRCLEAIETDEELEVVRIRNRMDPAADPACTGGFRNVLVNLRITSDWTRRLGVDLHVCELQLTLRAFAAAVTPESHRRYLILRNCRSPPVIWASLFRMSVRAVAAALGCPRRLFAGHCHRRIGHVPPAGWDLKVQQKDLRAPSPDTHHSSFLTEDETNHQYAAAPEPTTDIKYQGKGSLDSESERTSDPGNVKCLTSKSFENFGAERLQLSSGVFTLSPKAATLIEEEEQENCSSDSGRCRSAKVLLSSKSGCYGDAEGRSGSEFATALQDPLGAEREQMLVARFRSFANANVRYRGPPQSALHISKNTLRLGSWSFRYWSSASKYRGVMGTGVLKMAVAQVASGSVWSTSHPFAAALCKPYIPALFMASIFAITLNLGLGMN